MQVEWTFQGCDEHNLPVIHQYWQSNSIELDGKLNELAQRTGVPDDLRIAVERDDEGDRWYFQAALHIPGQTLVASCSSAKLESALDGILSDLARQVDDVPQPKGRGWQRREGLEPVTEFLDQWKQRGQSQPFLSFLTPILSTLRPYVGRELRVREAEGQLDGEEVNVNDVLDSVLVEAWEQFPNRSRQQAFDLWLVELAEKTMDRLGRNVASSSLDEPTPNPPGNDLPEDRQAWIEYVSYPETMALGELLPDTPAAQSWDDLDLESKQTHLSDMLSVLERDQRQAFVLNVAHGFEVAEIADFQNRSVQEIENDIAHATAEIRRWLTNEQTPDQEEPFVRAEMRERRRRR